ncbi:MAG: SPASM domain-containing protein, partial [Bacillota bacterium]|nr:SPASM domain-containing protein [Bacillota bacterium]
MHYIWDKKYRFYAAFNPKTGYYLRSNCCDAQGKQTAEEPFMASFPHLFDIGVMGHCIHGKLGYCLKAGVTCYQDGPNRSEPNMPLAAFEQIIRQCRGRVFQVALGGRGDPDQHENFADLLTCCTQNGIIPNFTTSGFGMTKVIADLCQQHCGAVAVSWYRQPHTLEAIRLLLGSGVKTNIHYVLNLDTLDLAVYLLESGLLPDGINAVLFLLHKPVGLGSNDKILRMDDSRVSRFFRLIESRTWPFKIGFDSCSVPALVNFTYNVDPGSIDTCEGGRFSAYISPDLKMLPCSFDQSWHWSCDVSHQSLQQAWESRAFDAFRNQLRTACPDCPDRLTCLGGCPICPEIV